MWGLLVTLLMVEALVAYPMEEGGGSGRVQACGRELKNIVDLVCRGNFNRMKPNKRNFKEWTVPEGKGWDEDPAPAHSELSRPHDSVIRVQKKQIISECCFRSCAVDLLKAYCATSSLRQPEYSNY